MEDYETIYASIAERIALDRKHFDDTLPRETAIAWRAYSAALLEWGALTVMHYDKLVKLLPKVDDDPTDSIMLGRAEE